jgi:hypothetical protein
MKATLKRFAGAKIREQQVGGPDEMLDADVSCVFVRDDGREVNCGANKADGRQRLQGKDN